MDFMLYIICVASLLTLFMSNVLQLAILLMIFISLTTMLVGMSTSIWLALILVVMYMGGVMVLLLYMASLSVSHIKSPDFLSMPYLMLILFLIALLSTPMLSHNYMYGPAYEIYQSSYSHTLVFMSIYLITSMITTLLFVGNNSSSLKI
nr:NADH dehydrogenase subunit 6 [Lamproglena orientalis]WKB11719.1 NADH dehydrogenase subunit 6 [Lamproglena orientalis]